MQRFKKEYDRRCGTNHPTISRFNHASNEYGKFIYGANGTLTQAARTRQYVFVRLKLAAASRKAQTGIIRPTRAQMDENFAWIRIERDISRMGGCVLP